MGKLKQLAGQTFIYGTSSIIGRILNYFLVPLYTNCFEASEYGIIVELYTYVTFLLIILTYGMETGFFNFVKSGNNPDRVYSTSLTSLFTTSSLFIFLGLVFSNDIATCLGYEKHVDYIIYFVVILGVDAFTSIPFARLRQQNKALKFALFKLIGIFVNIGLNLFFILWLPKLAQNFDFFASFYSKDFGVGYVFLANLISSVLTLLFFVPDFFRINYSFDFQLLKRMLRYSSPLIISGLAGMVNDFFDRVAIKFFYTIPDGIADSGQYILSELGIYGANAKIAVLMTLFIQCFRYAADPFFFNNKDSRDFNTLFANVNKYLLLFGLFIFVSIMGYIDVVKYFIASSYWEGLNVVWLLLIGHLLVGMVYLQSFWYKLSNHTVYGIYIFVIGAIITMVLDYIFVPLYGYVACAAVNVVSSFVMLVITYMWGRHYLPCSYDFRNMILYVMIAFGIFYLTTLTRQLSFGVEISINTLIIILFAFVVIKLEKLFVPLKKLLNKLLKR